MTKRFNYLKRKATLLKKAHQLNKLCDVNVCMVCFGPDKTVETWPENKSEVCDIISKYKLGYNMGREKKHNLAGFLENKKKKLEEKSNKKMKKKNLGGGCSVYSTWDERLNRFSEEELVGLCARLDSKLQNLTDKINLKKKNQKALVVNSPPDHHDLNLCNNVYRSNNPSPLPPLPLWFSGDCSSYNQQAFSGSDIVLGRAENFGVYGENYGNNYTNSSNMINNGFHLGNTYMGMAGESSSSNIDNYFHFDQSMVNSQGLYEIFPIAMRPPLPFPNHSAY
ncbi:hypothetical protein EZV62_013452 [Acer yangbiense]|uniref:MADS-box domain-containing protein n=1 Tax=Acer yangbiense TaxID=1000413 RepID=A0A5C7HZK6_9ROSI|nr:hypothetical protein EZV62_013452 [Acer yangbiense]